MADQAADGLAAGEHEQLVQAIETRFAAHLEAAGAAEREAEQALTDARERLARAQEAADGAPHRSDPLVFMRMSVSEEVEALSRKTNPKKARASYRFLLDRAVELAAGEVQGFHDDQAALQREREAGVEACQEAERAAIAALDEARAMHERVRSAETSAREGLALLVDKLTGD